MKFSGVIVSVCALALLVPQVLCHKYRTYGDLTFGCVSGWSQWKASCYLMVQIPATFKDAWATCSRQGGYMLYLDNEQEYIEYIMDGGHTTRGEKIWMGLYKDDDIWKVMDTEVPLNTVWGWGNGQPDENAGGCVSVSANDSLVVEKCDITLPYMCKRPSCLQGYTECDFGSMCIPDGQMCDGVNHCRDGYDEMNCPELGTNFISVSDGSDSFATGILQDGDHRMWTIEAPVGFRIRLFTPVLNLEKDVAFLEIFTGSRSIKNSRRMAKYTGNSIKGGYVYSDNNFFIVRVYANNVRTVVPSFTISYTKDFENVFNDIEDLIATPSVGLMVFPWQTSEYTPPKDLVLTWRITAPVGELITYYLDVLQVESDDMNDWFIKVKSNEFNGYMDIGEYFVTGGNQVLITMEGVPENVNIRLRYKTGCGGFQIADNRGTIYSPNYDQAELMPNDITCSWTLVNGQSVGRGMALKLTTSIVTDPRTSPGVAAYDALTVYPYEDGIKQNATEYIDYGNSPANIVNSTDGKFEIMFTADAAIMSEFFLIEFGTDCQELMVTEETTKSTEATFFEEDVILTCDLGYKFHLQKYAEEVSVTLTCKKDWYIGDEMATVIPECRIVYCGAPDKLENGYIVNATGVTHASTVTYACDPGFIMQTTSTPTCSSTGDWVDVPTCQSSSCNALPDDMLTDGSFTIIGGNNFTGNSADSNTVVEFVCDDGFELLGPVLSHCKSTDGGADGWTHELNTTPPTCQSLKCPLPDIANSQYSTNPVEFGGSLTVNCDSGYQFPDNTTTKQLNCQANQTFDWTMSCEDIDECATGNAQCSDISTTCENTIGSYTCPCKVGFTETGRTTSSCPDISECAVNDGGCHSQTHCQENDGYYMCTCPTGHKLYAFDGDQGFNFADRETGDMEGDIYHINHTCVPYKCPELSAPVNGMYLSKKSMFHYEDTVTLKCTDGYHITDLTDTEVEMTTVCLSDGSWNKNLSCSARPCNIPSTPEYGSFDVDSVSFGGTVTLTCNLTESDQVKRHAHCVYISTDMYLGGDNITECPEIDCGDPTTVMPEGGTFSGSAPSTHTYFPSTSQFTFDCLPGFDPTGDSEAGDDTVKCKANGRWSFGTLACMGKMCDDPGTPGNAKQIATSYAIGAVMYYTCNKGGYQLNTIDNYTCEYDTATNTAFWSPSLATLPSCIDIEAPMIGNCEVPDTTYYPMDVLTFTEPSASDNFQKMDFRSDRSDIKSGHVLTSTVTVTYTAEDFNSNVKTCTRTFNVYDRTTKPIVSCVSPVTISVKDDLTTPYNVTDFVTESTVENYETSLSLSRDTFTASVGDIGTSFIVTATASFTTGPLIGTESTCSFMVNFEAGACFQQELFKDINADRVFTSAGNGLSVNSTCKDGYVYGDGKYSKIFECTDANVWNFHSNNAENRFCLPIQESNYVVNVDLEYKYAGLTGQCEAIFTSKLTSELTRFESRLQSLCSMGWDVQIVSTAKGPGSLSSLLLANLNLVLLSTQTSNSERATCIQSIRDGNLTVFEFQSPPMSCGVYNGGVNVDADSSVLADGEITCNTNHVKITSTESGELCVPCGPGYFYDNGVCDSCPVGKYQDKIEQSACTSCESGLMPNADQTQCQSVCPAGYYSSSSFYPCEPCAADYYSTSSTTCEACPNVGSTDGKTAVTSVNQCYDPCPAGTYSPSGYSNTGCISCPLNFYQADPASTSCNECSMDMITLDVGSNSTTDCVAIPNMCHIVQMSTTAIGDGDSTTSIVESDAACKQLCLEENDCLEASFINVLGSLTCAIFTTEVTSFTTTGREGDRHYEKQCNQVCNDTLVCNGHGTCSKKNHERICDCNSQYYGNNCEHAYHQCDGHPCLNGGVCEEDSPTTFSCTCPQDLCDMRVVSTSQVGDGTPLETEPTASASACQERCLALESCAVASFLNLQIPLCAIFTESEGLVDASVDGSVHYEKQCSESYSGTHCEVDNMDNCADAGCYNGSKCMDKVDGFQCICPSAGGFTGVLCASTVSPCSGNPCGSHGSCQAFGTVHYECTCAEGWDGVKCDNNIDDCASAECLYGGECEDFEFGYSCTCPEGFEGLNCQTTRDYCASNDCSDNICYNSLSEMASVCHCDIDFFTDVYKCTMEMTPGRRADDNSTAIGGSQLVTSIDECITICQDDETCYYAEFLFLTIVNENHCVLYEKDGYVSTTDAAAEYTEIRKDCDKPIGKPYDCARSTVPCNTDPCVNGTCSDNGYVSTCSCEAGFTGSLCQHPVDDCVGNQCQHGQCVDEHSAYTCDCDAGYDGTYCENNINECPGMCNTTYGSCEDGVNGVTCICNPGYDGEYCQNDINECLSYPCQHGAECEDLVNDYECQCKPGWTGNNCESQIDRCTSTSIDCGSNGICYNLPDKAFCRCEGGAKGEFCEDSIEPCTRLADIDVCTNGGECTNKPGTAECTCPAEYTKTRCYFDDAESLADTEGGDDDYDLQSELSIEQCKTFCLDNQECVGFSQIEVFGLSHCAFFKLGDVNLLTLATATYYPKACPYDYAGKSCEMVKDWCNEENNPCLNGGTCVPSDPKGYECDCMTGYSGVKCQDIADPCSPNPCGLATCRATASAYICQCAEGKVFTGSECKGDIADHVLFVNNYNALATPTLQTPFRLESNALSIMVRVRVHQFVDTDSYLFAIIAEDMLQPEYREDNNYAFLLFVNASGIFTKKKDGAEVGILFSGEFGDNIHQYDPQTLVFLGISINSGGEMSAVVNYLAVRETVNIGYSPQWSLNGQISLGWLYIAELQNLVVYDEALSNADFVQEFDNTFSTSLRPVQGWWNYDLPYMAVKLTEPLSSQHYDDPNMGYPDLNCSGLTDVQFPTTDRIIERSEVFDADYSQLTSDTVISWKNALPETLTWAYYVNVVVALVDVPDQDYQIYSECRHNVYIKYHDTCPVPVYDSTEMSVGPCTSSNGYCDVTCSNPNKALFATVPSMMVCSSLGVWDNENPYTDLVLPGCTLIGEVKYVVTSSMQFQVAITCSNINNLANDISRILHRTFFYLSGDSNKWPGICTSSVDEMCDNIITLNAECGEQRIINVDFSISFDSVSFEASGGSEIHIIDVLRIIILLENGMIDIKDVGVAELLPDTVNVDMEETCSDGYSLINSQCLPCGPGWHYDSTSKRCKACPIGYYQDAQTQQECIQCDTGKTTYYEGSTSENDCLDTCAAGSFYDTDVSQCEVCPRHYYQDEEGQNHCKPCQTEYKTVGNASDSINDCKADCEAGYTRTSENDCVLCPRGYWRSLNYDDCVKCGDGLSTMLDVPAINEGSCSMDICNLGQYWHVENATCLPCDIGYYQDELLMLSCKQCPDHTTTNTTAAVNDSFCDFFCPDGEQILVADDDTMSCELCPRQYYKTNDGLAKFAPCVKCESDLTTEHEHSTLISNCSIPICDPGYYIAVTDNSAVCTKCAQDYYSEVAMPNSDVQCEYCGDLVGTTTDATDNATDCIAFCDVGEELVDEDCVSCMRGYYKNNEGSTRFDMCVKCDDGFTTDLEGSVNDTACSVYNCSAGYIDGDSGCEICGIDTYQPIDSPLSTTLCMDCLPIGGLDTGTRNEAVTDPNMCERYCPAGYVLNGQQTGCVACERGSYKSNDGNGRFDDTCTPCADGTTTEDIASNHADMCSIPKCGAGEYILDDNCEACPMDTYSDVELPDSLTECVDCSSCDVCDTQMGTLETGANSSALCLPICLGGETYDVELESCQPCAMGTYKPVTDRFGTCLSCEVVTSGYTTDGDGAQDSSECDLRDCGPGTYINTAGTDCIPCEVGYYQNESHTSQCIPCGEHLSTDGVGKNSSSSCQISCLEGFQGDVVCELCPEGTYKNVSGFASCVDCPIDYTSNTNRTKCDIVHCSTGREPDDSINKTGPCKPCEVGYMKSEKGAGQCEMCPIGYTTEGEGKTSCPKLHCVPGEYLADETADACDLCPVATFKALAGNEACTPCADDRTTEGNGSISVLQCDIVVCPPGKYREPSQKKDCMQCPVNTYQPETGAIECMSCNTGFITMQKESNHSSQCVPQCVAGEEYNAATKMCDNCLKRYFKASVSNTDMCVICTDPDRTTVGEGSISNDNCTENLCAPGTFYRIVDATTVCEPCDIGTYNDQRNQPSCTECPDQKTTFETGQTNIIDCIETCALGFGYSTILQQCEQCKAGEYNARADDHPNTCKRCPPGKTNFKDGSQDCSLDTNEDHKNETIDVSVVTVFYIAINDCNDLNAVHVMLQAILKAFRDLFDKTNLGNRANGFCHDHCINIVIAEFWCNDKSRRKRDTSPLSHELEIEFTFQNVSKYTTDENLNVDLPTDEVISKILTLNGDELTVKEDTIEFVSYSNVTTAERCNNGEKIENGVCVACEAGSYGVDGQTCMVCAINQYQNLTGQTSCKLCGELKFTEGTGSDSIDDCLPVCTAGHEYNTTSKVCDECEIGTYKAGTGNDNLCVSCAGGTTTTITAATSQDDCTEIVCEPGYKMATNDQGNTECMVCPLDTYSTTSGAQECISCGQDLTTRQVGSTSYTDCIPDCIAGYGLDILDNTCKACPENQYNNKTGNNPNSCKICQTGKTNFAKGQSSCPIEDPNPVADRYIDITIVLLYDVQLESCDSSNLEIARIEVEKKVRNVFSASRDNRYDVPNQTFCINNCGNIVVIVRQGSCALNGRRRKRAANHNVKFDVTFQNVSESTHDDKEALPTKDVVSEIVKINEQNLSPTSGGVIEYAGYTDQLVSEVCSGGKEPMNDACQTCSIGKYSADGLACVDCPLHTYQDEEGSSSCKTCPDNTYNNITKSTGISACKSRCEDIPDTCKNRGTCHNVGREAVVCDCFEGYTGDTCQSKSEPKSNMPLILGVSIGGGAAFLILIIIFVAIYKYCTAEESKPKKRKNWYDRGDREFYRGSMYDNVAFAGTHPLPQYSNVGYPALGYKPQDASYEEGSIANPYTMRHHNGSAIDEENYVWQA